MTYNDLYDRFSTTNPRVFIFAMMIVWAISLSCDFYGALYRIARGCAIGTILAFAAFLIRHR